MDVYEECLHIARLALSGRKDDVLTLLRRMASRQSDDVRPELRAQLREILSEHDDGGSSQRRSIARPAFDTGSARSPFLREDISDLVLEPVWSQAVAESLHLVVKERERIERLKSAGLAPSRSILFVGPPGVGKTLAARWLAKALRRQLVYVDLASLMSSHLGRTGANLSTALREASDGSSVLLLDEFDSIGKRRDDQSDVGELKRLVNVLLQALDQWPCDGLLIAATNHPELLDRAVWRRFDRVVTFPLPSIDELERFAAKRLGVTGIQAKHELARLVAIALDGESFSDAELWMTRCIRFAIVNDQDVEGVVASEAKNALASKPTGARAAAARCLVDAGMSQRSVANLLGMSRDTIRKHTRKEAGEVIYG
jgi:SpoVK/Ycf46/Vps4 family AAA+-type ATPase